MADSKISALTDGTPLQSADQLAIARSGSSFRVSGSGLPGAEINYTQITSPVNITGAIGGTPTTIISPGAIVFDGTAVLLTVFAPGVAFDTGSAGDQILIDLYEGATDLGILAQIKSQSITAQGITPLFAQYRFTPTAASHTYTIGATVSATTGTPKIEAGSGGAIAYLPAFARFTKA